MSEGITDNAHKKRRRRLTFHLHLMQHSALLRVLVSGGGSAAQFECFGDLTKALAFSPQRSTGVAECRVSERVGLIHAFDAGYDFRAAAAVDAVRSARPFSRSSVWRRKGSARRGPWRPRQPQHHPRPSAPWPQGCHVVDHRKTSSGDSRVDDAVSSPLPIGATRRCRSRPTVAGLAGRRPRSRRCTIDPLYWDTARVRCSHSEQQ